MSHSEFRFNKKRKHYSYLFKKKGVYFSNIILTTKPSRKHHGKEKKNVKLFKHPNPNCYKTVYVIPFIYFDEEEDFYKKQLKWNFHKNDKRIIKRIKKRKIK